MEKLCNVNLIFGGCSKITRVAKEWRGIIDTDRLEEGTQVLSLVSHDLKGMRHNIADPKLFWLSPRYVRTLV